MKISKLNYVDEAEKVMNELISQRTSITTSKIRNILSMTNELYADVRRMKEDSLDDEMQSRVQYLRLHLAYEAGRDRGVKAFVDRSGLLDIIKEIRNSKENLILFCNYMESLVAYHKYFGGRD